MYWSQLVGACEAVSSGITTVFDHAQGSTSSAHIERCLDATYDSGIRSVFAYSKIKPSPWVEWQAEHIHLVGHRIQASTDQRVTLGFGYDGLMWEAPADVAASIGIAKVAGSHLTTAHFVPTHFARPLTDVHAATNALAPDVVLAHFNHASPSDVALVKLLGVGIACTPETELAMGHGQCAVFDCAAQGIKAGLGVDAHIMCSGDIFAQMRLALQSARSIRAASLYFGNAYGQPAEPARQVPRFTVHTAAQMVRFATLGGAETLNMSERIGSLDVGKLADIILISLESPNMLGVTSDNEALVAAMVVLANASDVKTVVINGEIVKYDGVLKRVRWSDVVSKFHAQHKKLDAKLKQAGGTTDWDKKLEFLREAWGLSSEQI
ncbi:Metallo-dependent hydrolase, partial [Ramaria rubella]